MSLTKANNAFLSFLIERDEKIIDIIATKYNLDKVVIKKEITAGLDEAKFKPIKPRAKQPKEVTKDKVIGAKKKSCGYLIFSQAIKLEAKKLLIEDEDERTFVNSKGETIVIEETSFVNGAPTHLDVTKKCGSMWLKLSDEEKKKWNVTAAERSNISNGVVKSAIIEEVEEKFVEAEITSENSEEENSKPVATKTATKPQKSVVQTNNTKKVVNNTPKATKKAPQQLKKNGKK